MPKLKDLCKKCPESTIQFSKSGKSPYFQNSFLWLIDYISFNIDTTYTYYISNNWKLSQDFAELLQYELRYLREELWAHKQFSFFPPRPYMRVFGFSFVTTYVQSAIQIPIYIGSSSGFSNLQKLVQRVELANSWKRLVPWH